MNHDWLPTGTHHGLVIDREPTGRGGSFTGGGWKGIIHSTEGMDFAAMSRVLTDKHAEPNVLLGKVAGRFHVRQFIPFSQASRALEHPGGTLDTNNAHTIQIEVCEFATRGRDVWPADLYNALAILALMIENRVPIPRRRPRRFSATPNRYTQRGFVAASGWMGHQHVPSQPSGHWDPGNFQGSRFIDLMNHHAPQVKPRHR